MAKLLDPGVDVLHAHESGDDDDDDNDDNGDDGYYDDDDKTTSMSTMGDTPKRPIALSLFPFLVIIASICFLITAGHSNM